MEITVCTRTVHGPQPPQSVTQCPFSTLQPPLAFLGNYTDRILIALLLFTLLGVCNHNKSVIVAEGTVKYSIIFNER